jgi:hypothetical protein
MVPARFGQEAQCAQSVDAVVRETFSIAGNGTRAL